MDKYVYEICPFKDAHQRDGAAATSLGAWKGFEDTSMVFSGGQHCWNGPLRSIKVRCPGLGAGGNGLLASHAQGGRFFGVQVSLMCGAQEVLKHVQEPNRCEYAATLVTPAACDAQLAEELQERVREAERGLTPHDEL